MKKQLILLGVSAGLLVGLSSCQSTKDTAATGGYEEAMPMSELSVADGELPPWVLESDDATTQVPAGATTRNSYAIPEPSGSGSDSGATASASQKQPSTAATAPQSSDEVVVEDNGPVILDKPTPAATESAPEKQLATTDKSTAAKKMNAATQQGSSKLKNTKKMKVAKVTKPTWVVYKVRPGDNLSDIAKRSHTTVAQIRKDSGIKGDVIRPGQQIRVKFTPAGSLKSAKSGKTTGAVKTSSTYSVRKGDSLDRIARNNGVTVKELMSANGLSASSAAKIRPGDKLTIPAKAKATSSKSKTTSKSGSKKTTKSAKKSSRRR